MSANLSVVPSRVPSPGKTNWITQAPNGEYQFNGETYEDHLGAWDDAQNTIDGGLWDQALVAASLERKYGEATVKRFAHDVHRSAVWVRDMARAHRVFEKESQLSYLSFTHHVEAAKSDNPIEVLNKAHDNEWSTKELQGYVETGIEPEPKAAKQTGPKDPAFAAVLAKIHAKAVQDELNAKAAIVREWPQTAQDPLLAALYRRLVTMIEWQRDRDIERDCAAIMKIFTGEDGTEAPDRASDSYILAWLQRRGFIMSRQEIGHGGCSPRCPIDHNKHIEPSGRLGLMVKLKMLTVETREESRGPTQRGTITAVYAVTGSYAEKLDAITFLKRSAVSEAAIHKDWIERATRYAPELLPKKEEPAAIN